jgi:hypothetical protein
VQHMSHSDWGTRARTLTACSLLQCVADLQRHCDLRLVHAGREGWQMPSAQQLLDCFIQKLRTGTREKLNLENPAVAIHRESHCGAALIAVSPRFLRIGLVRLEPGTESALPPWADHV